MKATETGRDKVKKICEVLRKETLEPAEREASERLEKANEEAEIILRRAREEAEAIQEAARINIEKERVLLTTSMNQACRQALESLKQSIVDKLFNPELSKLLNARLQDNKVIANLIETVVKAIEKEGIEGDLSAYIPASVSAREVNLLVAPKILERLREKGVLVAAFSGGVEVKMHAENVTLDVTDSTVKEIVAAYARKDLRELLFGST